MDRVVTAPRRFGTCPGCGRAVRVDGFGLMLEHPDAAPSLDIEPRACPWAGKKPPELSMVAGDQT